MDINDLQPPNLTPEIVKKGSRVVIYYRDDKGKTIAHEDIEAKTYAKYPMKKDKDK